MHHFSVHFWMLQVGYLIFSFCGVFLKFGARHPFFSKGFLLCYAGSFLCVFLFALIWQQVLREYDLMTAYAWRGTVFLWTFLWAIILFDETVTMNNIAGAIIILSGIFLVIQSE